MKSKFLFIAFSLIIASHGAIGEVKLNGPFGERLSTMIENHVVARDVDYITAPFFTKTERQRRWQTEFWGKWMHSAVPYFEMTGSEKLKASIERSVNRILSTQEPSGYIGNYPDELRCGEGWDVWGMKYTMLGLLHYYDLEKAAGNDEQAENALCAAKRLCDYVIGEIGPGGCRGRELWQTGNWSGLASSSILEPVVWLYNRTKDKRYLDFATYIVKGMTEPASGPRLLDLALEGVSVADRSSSKHNGGYVMKHNRLKAYEMMSCYQGLLEYAEVTGRKDLVEAAVKTGEDIIREEVYSSAFMNGELANGKKVAFDMYSLYPRKNYARIVSHTDGVGVVPLKLRIPAWSAKTTVKLNGKVQKDVKPGAYYTIEHEWKWGDVVEITFDMPVIAHTIGKNVAFTRGPVLLARDSRFNDGDLTEPFRKGIRNGQVMTTFTPVRTPSDAMAMVFSATLPIGSHHENPEAELPTTVFFCDYASAGNTWTRDNYYRTWFPVELWPGD